MEQLLDVVLQLADRDPDGRGKSQNVSGVPGTVTDVRGFVPEGEIRSLAASLSSLLSGAAVLESVAEAD